MKRWHISKEWYIVWVFTLFIGGLILYVGYSSANSEISIEKPQVQADVNGGYEAESKKQVKSNAPQQNMENDLKLVFGQGISLKKTLSLKDFPSPVHAEPIRGIGNYYSEAYDDYIFHAGLDYALKEGTVIRATQGGQVVFAGEDPILGKKVTLDCGEGWLVTYGGMDNLRVKEGETIEEQTALGQIGYFPGGEGESNQPQLHYEVWHSGELQHVQP